MSKRILIIQGHPQAGGQHFNHALAQAYAQGARDAGHDVQTVDVATLDFPILRSKPDWDSGALPASLAPAQQALGWAEHLVLFFPLWLGGMPALLKGFLEQVARPGFAISAAAEGSLPHKLLKGRSARVVVTMGMPALIYRWYFGAHGLKSLERSILGFCGIGPIRESLFGMIEAADTAKRDKWLRKMRRLGGTAR